MEETTDNNPEQSNEVETSTNEAATTKKGFEFLRELCSFKADFNAYEPRTNPVTNRVGYIMHQLNTYNVPFTVDQFRADGIWNVEPTEQDLKYINLYVYIQGLDNTKTVVFDAHHDVANKDSENCQDNSASVCNLLDLAIQLSKEQPPCNVLIAFTDAEEIVNLSKCGANRVARKIATGVFGDVKLIYVLELTANGIHYWYSFQTQPNAPVNAAANHMKQLYPNSKRVRVPFNNSWAFESNLLPSVCIGSLIESELKMAQQGYGCKTWAVCHSQHDTFENFAHEADMDAFVLFMRSLL